MALTGMTLALAGCLEGERPRISEMYPAPALQVPTVTTKTTETTTQVYTAPGTTFYYEENTYPQIQDYREPYWDRGHYRRYPPHKKAGTGRYYYPQAEVRCDNAVGACLRWSGRQGRYIPDAQATQKVYGTRQTRPIRRYQQGPLQSSDPGKGK